MTTYPLRLAVRGSSVGGMGLLQLAGTRGAVQLRSLDSFYSFKAQLADFIGYLHTGVRPYPFSETVELTRLILAGLRSRDDGGRVVQMDEFRD